MDIFIKFALVITSIYTAFYEIDAIFGVIHSLKKYRSNRIQSNYSALMFWSRKLLLLNIIFVFSIILFGYKNAVFLTFDTYVVFLNFKGMLKRNRPNYFSLYHVLKRIFAYTKEFIQSIKLT